MKNDPSGALRYELLVQSITDYAVYLVDPQGIVVTWNAGAQRFKGYEPNEIIGRDSAMFYSDEDRAAGVPARALRTAAEVGRFESEGWRMRKDGSCFWASFVIDRALDAEGRLTGFAQITRDLTARHASDEALRQSEERFRLMVQSVTDYAIYMLDPDGIVTSWNAGAERAKGYTAADIIGKHFSRFYGPEDRMDQVPERALATARATGRFEAEGWRYRKDGSRFWASVVIDSVHDPSGELIGFAKVTRDLSERRLAEIALEQAQQALVQSQKMDAIGQLTGGVAHDFNNLLAAILGSLELARRRAADGKEVSRFLDNAMRAAERGAALTQRMLAFARKQKLQLVRVDVAALIGGMMELLRRTIGASVAIETRIAPDIAAVRADFGQLELAILNLVVNARDATADGGLIVIAADLVRGTGEVGDVAEGTYVRIAVSDSGHGMDAETLAHAMEPFFTTKGVGKGTGLGLSMVHGLADQSGGTLKLESEPGRGTTASLWLPMIEEAEPERIASPVDLQATALPAMLVLAVDDDPLVLMNTIAMLEDMGHRVVSAVSGTDALDAMRAHPIECVVSDYAMPGMTGSQLAGLIEAEWPHIPVLLVSGYADLGEPALGASITLSKPFSPLDLERALVTMVHERAALDAP